jgi:hypothetical protein
MNEAREINVEVDRNPFALAGPKTKESGGMIAVAASRQAQEVQAAMVIAKKFPRNQEQAYSKIMEACKRKGLAESALYSYPRGGQQITGPSIRLAESLAQNWGNLDFGIIELDQRDGESTVMSYCIDLETNTRQCKIFQIAHERKANGTIKRLDDPRDIYELTANQGARRLRACILGVIPGDIIDAAVEQVEKTLKGGKEPLIDRIRVMATRFTDFGVTVDMLEARLQHKLDATNEQEIIALGKIFNSLRDGASKREQWFDFNPAQKPEFSESKEEPQKTAPNPELGAAKARSKPKAGRDALIYEVREKLSAANVNEVTFLEILYNRQFVPQTTTLQQFSTELLKELLTPEIWNAVIAEVSNE